jgi:hypothetical protein
MSEALLHAITKMDSALMLEASSTSAEEQLSKGANLLPEPQPQQPFDSTKALACEEELPPTQSCWFILPSYLLSNILQSFVLPLVLFIIYPF